MINQFDPYLLNVNKEIENIIRKFNFACSVDNFSDYIGDTIYWHTISRTINLSEDFIRKFMYNVYWPYISEYQILSENFMIEFQSSIDWICISIYQKLSENFIREFQDKVNWRYISEYQNLSESFIREFKHKICWIYISKFQKLSEDFIREFKDKVNWEYISQYQKLSESFIREFQDNVDWFEITVNQNLSKEFLEEFKYKIAIKLYNRIHNIQTRAEKIQKMTEYALKYNLKFDGEYLYAYRNHDKWGRGSWNNTIIYENGKYYRDWHCDMRPDVTNSFGLGIWPEGNTPVKVSVDDWGVWVNRDDGKCRVWGFTVIGERKES